MQILEEYYFKPFTPDGEPAKYEEQAEYFQSHLQVAVDGDNVYAIDRISPAEYHACAGNAFYAAHVKRKLRRMIVDEITRVLFKD